jgi:hypothetical protein
MLTPFDGMDFRYECAIDEASFVEDLITRPIRESTAQHITDCVMFQRKERVEHLHSYPPIVVESCQWISISVARKELHPAFFGELQLAVTVPFSESLRYGLA